MLHTYVDTFGRKLIVTFYLVAQIYDAYMKHAFIFSATSIMMNEQ